MESGGDWFLETNTQVHITSDEAGHGIPPPREGGADAGFIEQQQLDSPPALTVPDVARDARAVLHLGGQGQVILQPVFSNIWLNIHAVNVLSRTYKVGAGGLP